MRVDLYSSAATTETTAQTTRLGSSDKAASVQTKHTTHTAVTEDKTTLTSASDKVQSLTQNALQSTPSRAAKVQALKQAVSTASYQLDSAKIAAALANADV